MELEKLGSLNSGYITKLQSSEQHGTGTKIESPEINPYTYDQLICDRGDITVKWSKDNLSNKCC